MQIAATSLTEVKLVMLGSSSVGKSSIVTRLTKSIFKPDCVSTVGASYLSKTVDIDGTNVKLQIWDTGGSERYRAMAPMYFRDADACLVCYDITSKNSFDDVDNWLQVLNEKGPEGVLVALAGNKADLELLRAVKYDTAAEYAKMCNIKIFYETSALNGQNIDQIFMDIASVLAQRKLNGRRSSVCLTLPPNRKSMCC